MDRSRSVTVNLGFLQVLAVVLVVMKLTGELQISWLAALAPLWLPVAFVAVIVLGFGVVLLAVLLSALAADALIAVRDFVVITVARLTRRVMRSDIK